MIHMSRTQWENLQIEDWHDLGIYQDFYQNLLIEISQESQDEKILKDILINQFEGVKKTLFTLTAHELIDQLIEFKYCYRQESLIVLNPKWYKKVLQQQSLWVEQEQEQDQDEKTEAINEILIADSIVSDSEQTQEYLDPMSYLSDESESLFTANRLENVLNALDGLTLLEKQLNALLNLSTNEDFQHLINVMEHHELIRREAPFIRLNFHGNKVVRLNRSEKQKTLARLASRMRREDRRRKL